MPTQSKEEKPTLTIQDIISAIEAKSADGSYIYRGERKLHNEHPYCGKVSSNLWREYCIDNQHFDIEVIQKELLNAAKKHIGQLPQDYTASTGIPGQDTDETIDFEILTDIQHYEGKTNLIDFATDYFIALFFSCDGSPNEDGRVILQKTDLIKNWIKYPKNPRHRVIAQKSVFVRHPRGFIEPQEDDVVTIPAYLKQTILQHLRKYHGISKETIYNDLHGFIRNQDLHGDSYTYFYKGLVCDNRLEYEEAIKHYTKAIQSKLSFWEAYTGRGNAYEEMGESDKAIKDFTKSIELNPDNAVTYSNRSISYKNKGEYERAIEDCNIAIQLMPNLAEAYNNRGNAYHKKGEVDRAIQDFDKVIQLEPNDANAYNNRGLSYDVKGEVDRAIQDFDMATQFDPNLVEVYSNRGNAYQKKDKIDRAIENYNKAIELNSDYAIAYNNRGFAHNSKGDFEQAIKDYKKAIQLDPNYTTAHANLNKALLNLQIRKNQEQN